jgi:ElaB/YqjD/DUF883 family membrane-anchored ribosome-binding protein
MVVDTLSVIQDEALRNKYLAEIKEVEVKATEAATQQAVTQTVVQETKAPVKETQAPVQETQQVVQETQAPVPTSETLEEPVLWSSVFVTLVASKFVGLLLGVYWSCQITSRVFHTAPRLRP